jgi:ribonuclease HII
MSSKTSPTTDFERALLAEGVRFIIGIDEVGRGAVAGPVAVGAALFDAQTGSLEQFPKGLRDSKLLSQKQRLELVEPLETWLAGNAVGWASAQEIDERGIIWSLATAASRALTSLLEVADLRASIARDGAIVLLDGNHDWLAEHAGGLRVVVREKADRDCAVVSAAAVLAKVRRDRQMESLAEQHPGYELEGHKGYASAKHMQAIRNLGPSPIHRVTWLGKILAASND